MNTLALVIAVVGLVVAVDGLAVVDGVELGIEAVESMDVVDCNSTASGNIYSHSAQLLDKTNVTFSQYKGKVSVFVPVSNFDARASQAYLGLRNIALKFQGQQVAFALFSTGQFGWEDVFTDPTEFMNVLKYVRPGQGFEAPVSWQFFGPTDIGGKKGQSVFNYFIESCSFTREQFRTDLKYLELRTNDVRNPFELFLVGKDGTVRYRYDDCSSSSLAADIQRLLDE